MDIIDLSRLGISGLFILLNIVNYFRQRKLRKKIIKDYSDWIWLTVGFEIVILCLETIIILILDQNYEKLTLPLFLLFAKISLLKPTQKFCHSHIWSFLLCEFVFSIYRTILDLDFNRIWFWINVAKFISNGSLFILFVIPTFWNFCFEKDLSKDNEDATDTKGKSMNIFVKNYNFFLKFHKNLYILNFHVPII